MYDERIKNETLKYISDWQKRAKKMQLRYNFVMITALIIAVVVCTAFVLRFRSDNYNRIIDHNKKYIEDSAIQEADQVEIRLNDSIKLVEKYAKQYLVLDERTQIDSIEQKLDLLCDRTLFDRIAYVDAEGNDTSVAGKANVGDRSYFLKAMAGESGYEYIEKSRVTGKASLIFYAPIKKDEKIIGVLTGFYERDRLDDLLSYKFLNYSSDSYLVDSSGTVIANSRDKLVTWNMFDRLSDKNFTGEEDYGKIQEAIADETRTSVSFDFDVDGKTSIGVIAQFSSSDWMIVSILPTDVTESMVNNANRSGNIMVIAIIGTLVVLTALLTYILMRRYHSLEGEMTLTIENLQKAISHDRIQSFIIESLGNTYSSVYFADIVKGEYERVKEFEQISLALPERGNWKETYSRFVGGFVDPAYHDAMAKFGNISDLDERIGENENITIEYQRPDKLWRRVFIIPVVRDENGKIVSFIFAVQRIDAEKQRDLETQRALQEAYEAAQLASMAKTTFLSNMSHDIRTPMNAIVGMTAIAGANLDNREKVSDCLKKIAGASKHLLGLINEVLDMSKIESGKVDLSDEDFSLSTLIDELITMNQSHIAEKHHTLTVKINRLTHENVIGDSTRLQQVFTNLLTNAIKYTPENGKIDIIVTEKDTNKPTIGWYEVKFRDNGIGMSEEFRKRIFDPFSRADDSRIANIQGTGLGMAIARNIVRMMNGDLTVESEINKGTTFTVTFALMLQNEESVDYSDFVDLPVLVVDDDESVCESTCTMLDSLSMNSEWVTTGKEAVEKTVERHEKNDDYYAVIVDWKMPDMDGIATTRAIRQKVGDEVPIIVLTAYDWSDIEQDARAAGVNAFLAKPLFKSKLVSLFMDFKNKNAEVKPQYKEFSEQDFTGKRILLAEDNELNSEIAVEILSMMGLEIEVAENGKICLETFEKSKPGYYDMIFMDIQMPVMNGYEATKAIRASKHKDAKKIPIVAMTANAFSTDVRSAFDAGMNGHISKPIEIGNVIKALKENLK